MQKKKVQKKKKVFSPLQLDDAWLFHFEARRTREASVALKEASQETRSASAHQRERVDGIVWKMMTREEDQRRLRQ